MAELAPTNAGIEEGWESQTHGPAPWITTPDGAASYLEGTAFFMFWATWADVPATDALIFDVQSRVNGYAVLRVSRSYSQPPAESSDLQIGNSEWSPVEQPWLRNPYGSSLSHPGGPLTLWFRTTNVGGFWEGDYSYVGIVTEESGPTLLPYASPPRRIYPRDDGMTGGARRTWPPSKSQQWGSRVDGSGYV